MRTVMRSSRRRFCAFCDFALVSNQIWPSRTPYHMATTCGAPVGPMVAMVAVRLRRMNSATSPSGILICARWLMPIDRPLRVATGRGRCRARRIPVLVAGAPHVPTRPLRAGSGDGSAVAVAVAVLVAGLGEQPAGRGQRGGQAGGLVD